MTESVAHRSPPYFLAPEVHFCVSQQWYVFLDLSRDRYSCVSQSPFDALAPALLAGKLFTSDPAVGRPVVSTIFTTARRDLERSSWVARRRTSVVDAGRVLAGSAWVARSLKRQSIAATVAGVRERRRAADSAQAEPAVLGSRASAELWRLRHHMADFHTVRPWFWREYRCLFDSLAAFEYLSRFSLLPRLVIGVRAEPFEAHCWLQEGDAVVNDTLDQVIGFSPILVV